MKLNLHIHSLSEEANTLIASLIPKKDHQFISHRWTVPLESPVLSEILKAGESFGGHWVSVEAVLSKAEQRGATHFEAVCRKVVNTTQKDDDKNQSIEEKTPLIDGGGEEPIRLVQGFFITRIGLKPNMVGSIAEWGSEYVCGTAVVRAFDSDSFSGATFLPVTNTRTSSPHDDFKQIYSDRILGPAVIDSSVQRIEDGTPEENGLLRHLGVLSYPAETLSKAVDFQRTAEPWEGWMGYPSWVVSRNVVDTFRSNKFRGWAFRPVLIRESDTYSAYMEQWSHLHRLMSQYSQSIFDGGRW